MTILIKRITSLVNYFYLFISYFYFILFILFYFIWCVCVFVCVCVCDEGRFYFSVFLCLIFFCCSLFVLFVVAFVVGFVCGFFVVVVFLKQLFCLLLLFSFLGFFGGVVRR